MGGIPPTERSFSGGGILTSMGGDFGIFGFMGGSPPSPPTRENPDPPTVEVDSNGGALTFLGEALKFLKF